MTRATLYRSSNFGHLTGKGWVKVMTGSTPDCAARADELRQKGFRTSMQGGVLNADWFGVPAGTELVIIDQFTDWQDNPILVVERIDGQQLPSLGGDYVRSNVAASFVDFN